MSNFICFVTGPCAAGKSTVGKMLAQSEQFPQAMFIEADTIRRMVWSGYVPPFPETEASKKQLQIAAKAASAIAKLYYEECFIVFIEEVLEPWLLPEYKKLLSGCTMKVIYLLPEMSELVGRDKYRSQTEQMKEMGSRCLEMWESFRVWSKTNNWLVIDSSNQSPEQTLEQVQLLLKE